MRTKLKGYNKSGDSARLQSRYCMVAAAVVGSAVVGGVASSSAANKAAKASKAATDANSYQGEIASDQWNTYKEIYQPLEKEMVADAQKYDSKEAYDKAATSAQATVSTQLGLAKERLTRTPGLDPSSAAAQAAQVNLELKGAALGATSQNQAREAVTDKAYARKLDAVGLGKGLSTNATTGLASAAATSQQIAASQMQQANTSAANAGSLASGVIGGLSKINWGTKPPPVTNAYSMSDNLGTVSGSEVWA